MATPHCSRAVRAACSGPSPSWSSTETGKLGNQTRGIRRDVPGLGDVHRHLAVGECLVPCELVVERRERKCGMVLSAATSSGRTAKKPGSTHRRKASCATLAAVGRLAPVSQAATAVALFSTRAARSLLRSTPGGDAGLASSGCRQTVPQRRQRALRYDPFPSRRPARLAAVPLTRGTAQAHRCVRCSVRTLWRRTVIDPPPAITWRHD